MRGTVGVVVFGLVIAPSCAKKKEEGQSVAGGATATGSATATAAAGPSTVDEMLKRSFASLGGDHFVSSIDIDYVRADGTLDPQYGEMTIETGKRPRPKPPKPAGDPNRPIGAPEPPDTSMQDELMDSVMAKCPHITWKGGEMTSRESSCSMFRSRMLTFPRCTIVGILASARDAGAPANALARITFEAGYVDNGQSWTLKIDDNPRDIHFRHEGKDDCEAIVEKP